jgi:hypothetical protein
MCSCRSRAKTSPGEALAGTVTLSSVRFQHE